MTSIGLTIGICLSSIHILNICASFSSELLNVDLCLPHHVFESWSLISYLMQAMDRFRENENGILVATDVAARGLDIPGIRTVVHYQLPHSADVS